jgi:hypothetical protein
MPRKAPLQENGMEDDDDVEPTQKPQQKKRKRREAKDRTSVMDGQTEEERRILRQEQRNLQDRIGERRAAMCALDSDEFKNQRAANNGLFKKVRYNREMVNDGDIMVGLAECAVARAGALAKSVKQYGAKDICDALKESYSNSRGEMDWAALGRDGAGLFRAPPELNFFCGPLERPVKERKKVERKKKADLKDDGVGETKFEQREGGGGDGDEVCSSVCNRPPGKLLVMCLDHTSQVQTTRGYYDAVRGAIGVLPLVFRIASSPLRSPSHPVGGTES